MTLREAIDKSKYEYLYIGSGSSYMFAGLKEDAVEAMQKADEDYYQEIIKTYIPNCIWHIKSYETRLAEYPAQIRALQEKVKHKRMYQYDDYIAMKSNLSQMEHGLKTAKEKLPYYQETLKKLYNTVRYWTPFLDRQVKETYKRKYCPPFGQCIIFEGTEIGRVWTVNDYQEWKRTHAR